MAGIRVRIVAAALMAPLATWAQGVDQAAGLQDSSIWMKCVAALAVIGFIAARRKT